MSLFCVRDERLTTSVCTGSPGAPPFEALGFPTVSFQRWCSPIGAGASPKSANHRAAARPSGSAGGPIRSQCALTSQRGERKSRHVTPGVKYDLI